MNKSLFLYSMLISTMLSTPVLAANSPKPDVTVEDSAVQAVPGVNEIIVTAQKRSESANRVPIAIQAFSGDTLRQAGVSSPGDIANIASSFNFSKSSANTPIFTVRGIGFDTPNLSSTSPVGIYVDEVAYAYPYMANGPMFDIERIEVLKGPQGTLYGRNTTGGLVNFIQAKPTKDFHAGVTVEAGNYQTYNAEGFISGPISDTLRARFAVRSENSDKGWQISRSRPGDRLGEKDKLGARLLVDWTPTDRLKVSLGASYWRDRSDTVAQQGIVYVPISPPFADPATAATFHRNWNAGSADWTAQSASDRPSYRTNSKFYSLSLRADYELTDKVNFTSLTGYNDIKRRDMNDIDGTPSEISEYLSNGSIKSFSQEIRLSGAASRFDWIAGAYYSRDKINDDQVGYFRDATVLNLLAFLGQSAPNPRYTPAQIAGGFDRFRNDTNQVSRTFSGFVNGNLALSDTLKAGAGLRYTDDRLSFAGCSRDYNNNTAPVWNTGVAQLVSLVSGRPYVDPQVAPNACLTYRADFSGINPINTDVLHEKNLAGRLNLNWTPNPNTLVYASASRGFKSGAFPNIAANTVTQLAPAKQEKVTAYELGIKAGLFDRTLQVNAAIYYYDYRNKQLFGDILDPIFMALQRIVNVPKSEVYGAEADLTFRPTRELMLQISGSYTHSEITQYVGYSRLAVLTDFKGSAFPYTPKYQLTALSSYDLPINERLGLEIGVNASYRNGALGAIGNDPDFDVESYTVVNADLALHAQDNRWRAGLWARNLFNENYYTATNRISDGVSRVPAMPRTFGLRLSYRY